MKNQKQVPELVRPLTTEYIVGLEQILKRKLYGAYLHGASVFPETGPITDVDFHVILRSELTAPELANINSLHRHLAEQYPPLGEELDSYYILKADTTGSLPPTHQLDTAKRDDWWALHRAHMLAGRCVVLVGPEPSEIFTVPSWHELSSALRFELSWIDGIIETYPAYCVLNLCRVMYSFETEEIVVSKRGMANKAAATFPEWTTLIESAIRVYDGADSTVDAELLHTKAVDFQTFVLDRVERTEAWKISSQS